MTAVVSVETVLLVLLIVLVVGLLRSHAEILRRLGPPDAGSARVPGTLLPPGAAAATAVRSAGAKPPAIAGSTRTAMRSRSNSRVRSARRRCSRS